MKDVVGNVFTGLMALAVICFIIYFAFFTFTLGDRTDELLIQEFEEDNFIVEDEFTNPVKVYFDGNTYMVEFDTIVGFRKGIDNIVKLDNNNE